MKIHSHNYLPGDIIFKKKDMSLTFKIQFIFQFSFYNLPVMPVILTFSNNFPVNWRKRNIYILAQMKYNIVAQMKYYDS